MEDNQIKDIQALDMPPALRSAWPESILPLVPVGVTPHTSGSLQVVPKDNYVVYRLPDGTVVISAYGQPWKRDTLFDEQNCVDLEADYSLSNLFYGSPAILNEQNFQNTGFCITGNAATMTGIAVANRHQTDSPSDDSQTADLSGIFTFQRSPKVIFSTCIDLSSPLPKRKPFISLHDLSID